MPQHITVCMDVWSRLTNLTHTNGARHKPTGLPQTTNLIGVSHQPAHPNSGSQRRLSETPIGSETAIGSAMCYHATANTVGGRGFIRTNIREGSITFRTVSTATHTTLVSSKPFRLTFCIPSTRDARQLFCARDVRTSWPPQSKLSRAGSFTSAELNQQFHVKRLLRSARQTFLT